MLYNSHNLYVKLRGYFTVLRYAVPDNYRDAILHQIINKKAFRYRAPQNFQSCARYKTKSPNTCRGFLLYSVALPGIEPGSQASEARILSIVLQGRF